MTRTSKLALAAVVSLAVLVPALSRNASAHSAPIGAPIDTVILRVTSPRGGELTFSGTISFRGQKDVTRIENARTPFEIRLPVQDLDARFITKGGTLQGEIVTMANGHTEGRVGGEDEWGDVKLFFDSKFGFGFGSRFNRIHLETP